MRTTGYRTTRSGAMAYRAYARTRNQRIGYARLMLVSVATAGLIGIGVGVAALDRPLAGRHCSVPEATTHDATGLTLSCGPASTGNRELVWRYVPAS
ncbi:Ig-like domain-containing protein [Mycobacterium colombiense]